MVAFNYSSLISYKGCKPEVLILPNETETKGSEKQKKEGIEITRRNMMQEHI